MPVLALGVSYRKAPVELLERMSFTDDDYPKAYRQLLEMHSVDEAAILSTCNRIEVFASVDSYHAGFQALKRFLSESREILPEEFAEPLYSHYEDDAAEHLFRVAAGIDSMVIGEPQILSQVRQAYRRAESEGAIGRLLAALFRDAIRAGRRARAETEVGASPSAFAEAGAELAAAALGGLRGRSVLVVGAGGMAGLALTHLRERGVGRVRVVNRSLESAARLAARIGGEAGGLGALADVMAGADLVVSATGSAGVVIGADLVRQAVAANGRGERPLFLLDLAVPRDIDPAAAELPGVRLAGIEDLRDLLASRGESALAEVERVRSIVAEEVARFSGWRRAARLAPLIQALRERGERVQAAELARLAPRLGGLDDRQREAVEALARGIVAKMLHDPIVRVKELAGPGVGDAYARALADLFGIDFDPGA
jgi:glutamyl-tRNA reductase